MNFYPEKINERFQKPKNTGILSKSNAAALSAAFICGSVLRVSLRIDSRSKEVLDARFTTNGCGYVIAAADVLFGEIKGRKLTELHGLDQRALKQLIEDELGEFPEGRAHCLEICLEALRDALADFRSFQLEEFTGEKALICTCFGVSEEAIKKIIREKKAETVAEVGAACNAGTGCGSCQSLIGEIIDLRFDILN